MARVLVWSPEAIEDIEYRIIYRLDQARVLVTAVIHGRQEFEPFVTRIQSALNSDL